MNTGRYDDILYLPHHRSERHPPMPNAERAAQFSPFAALTGHEDVIAEAAQSALDRTEHEILRTYTEGDEPWVSGAWEFPD